MTTPILRNAIGAPVSLVTANAISSNAYANAADKLHILNAGNALLADFTLTGVTFAAAPVTGVVQLIAIDRDSAGNPGPAPAGSMLGRVYPFSPKPSSGNALTGWVMTCNSVPLSDDCDYWLYNNGTAQQIAAGCTLTAKLWSPGA